MMEKSQIDEETAAPSRKRARPRDAEDTRRVLIESGLALFLEHGYQKTSVQAVVARARVTKGAFYHHFDSKDDLLLFAHTAYLVSQLEILDGVMAKVDVPFAERVREIVHRMVDGVIEHRAELSVFLEERRSLSGPGFESVRILRNEFETKFVSFIREAVEREEIRAEVAEARLIALGILGMISWTYQWIKADDAGEVERIKEVFTSMILGGVLSRTWSTER